MTTKSLDEMTAKEVLAYREHLRAFISAAETGIAASEADAKGGRSGSTEGGDAPPSRGLLN